MIKKISEYFLTAFVVCVVVVLLALSVELELLFRCENYVNKNELNMANLVKFATIEQLEKRLMSEPENYVVSIKLAQIYEGLGEYDKAEEFYASALAKSDKSVYVLYNYALFCAHAQRFAKASSLCEDILGTSKKVLKYKAQIYEAIGDNMLEKSPRGALRSFQISYKYAKNLSDKNYLRQVAKKYAQAYVVLADYYVRAKEFKEAISSLENSLKIDKTAIAEYKLGLLYLDYDKQKAEKYISSAFLKEPYIVNPYIYNFLVQELINNAISNFDTNSQGYYQMKLNKFKSKMLDAYLYKGDIDILNTNLSLKRNKNTLSFDIKNNTKIKISQLYMNVEIYINSNQYGADKKVVKKANTIPPEGILQGVVINLPDDIIYSDMKNQNSVIIKFFAKKSRRSPDTLVEIQHLNF